MQWSEEFRTARVHVATYVGLLIAHLVLLWLLPFLPTQDGPTHTYNLAVLHDLLHGKGDWGHFYGTNLRLVPNLGFGLVTYPLLSILSPIAAERAFVTIYVLLLATSVPVFLAAFGRPALPLSYFAFITVFNKPFLMGFYSSTIGVPLLLLALALGWRIRHRRLALRVLALNAAGLLLFAIHLVPIAIFLLALTLMAAVEGSGWWERGRNVISLAAVLSPCLLFFALFIIRYGHSPIVGWSFSPLQILLELGFFSGVSFSPWQMLPAFAALLLFLAAAIQGLKQLSWSPAGRSDPASGTPFAATLCAALLVIYLVAPDGAFGGNYFKMRLPWTIVLVALPLLQPSTPLLPRRQYARLALLVAVLSFAVNAAVLYGEERELLQFVRGFEAGVPRGATVLTARFDAARRSPDALMHAASYYGLRGAIDLSDYEARLPYCPVRFRDALPLSVAVQAYKQPYNIAWSRFPQVQFLLCWKAGKDDRARLAQHFTLFWEQSGCPLTIWKRQD